MQMFVATSTYQRPLTEVDQAREGHLEWVAVQYRAGRFLVSGRQVPPVGGVIIGHAANREQFEELLAGDPFVRTGVSRYEVVEFTATAAALATPGFGLFAEHLAAHERT